MVQKTVVIPDLKVAPDLLKPTEPLDPSTVLEELFQDVPPGGNEILLALIGSGVDGGGNDHGISLRGGHPLHRSDPIRR